MRRSSEHRRASSVVNTLMLKHHYTQDQIEELRLCLHSPAYFIERHLLGELTDDQHLWISSSLETEAAVPVFLPGERNTRRTTTMLAYGLWHSFFRRDRTTLYATSRLHQLTAARAVITELLERVPTWLKPAVQAQARSSLRFNNGASFLLVVANGDRTVRGLTLSLALLDNSSYYEDRAEVLGSVMSALQPGSQCWITD